MSSAITVAANTPQINITESSAMILTKMASYVDQEAGIDRDEYEKDSRVASSEEWPVVKVANNSTIQNKVIKDETGSQQQNKTTEQVKSESNCLLDKQNFNNQTSAIKQMNQRTCTTFSPTTSSNFSQSQYQFQHQEEANKMRERLFRLLSKVPIQVQTIQANNSPKTSTPSSQPQGPSSSSSGSGSSNSLTTNQSEQQEACNREPLIIKYYNERYLAEILDLHFSCSLKKHNNDRRLAIDNTSLGSELVGSNARSNGQFQPYQYSNNQNQMTLAYCLNRGATEYNMPNQFDYKQQQQLNQQQQHTDCWQVQSQHPAVQPSNLQWQSYGANQMELKQSKVGPSTSPGSYATDTTRRLARSSCSSSSNSSSSDHRGSLASIVMKGKSI